MWLAIAPATLASCIQDQPNLTFINKTDSRLCYHEFRVDPEFCNEVAAHASTDLRPECSQGGKQPLTVVLTADQRGPEVYRRTATCDEWKDAHGTITIEQRDARLAITDNLSQIPL